MVWQLLALGSAFTDSLFQLGTKKWLHHESKRERAHVFIIAGLVLLALTLATGIPVIKQNFWLYAVADSIALAIAMQFYFKAFATEDASLVSPMLSITPLFMLVLSPLIVGDNASGTGVVAVLLIALGAFFLNYSNNKQLKLSTGILFILATSFIFAITGNIIKLAALESNAFLAGGVSCFLAGVILLAFNNQPLRQKKMVLSKNELILGGMWALQEVFILTAITQAPAQYVIAVKRTSGLFTILAATHLLKERNALKRLIAAILMIAGNFLLAFA